MCHLLHAMPMSWWQQCSHAPPLNLGISKARMHMATHSSSSREDLDKKSESESEGSFDGRRELGAGI